MENHPVQQSVFARYEADQEVTINMTIFPAEMRRIPIHARHLTSSDGDLWIGNEMEEIFVPKGITISLIPGRYVYIMGKGSKAVSAQLHFTH